MKRLVVCLDGTWNNPNQKARRTDGSVVLRPSNVLKIARGVTPVTEGGLAQITYYDSGVGALGKYPGISNRIMGFVDSKLGGAFGAGFEANVEQAVTFLVNNHRPNDEVFVFGFSRGAAEARAVTRFISWMKGLPPKDDAYFLPLLYEEYLRSHGRGNPTSVTTSSGRRPTIEPVRVKFLGVWDTVMALGSRFRSNDRTSVAERSFHVGPEPAECVENARHAIAIDEQRYDFRPEIWSGAGATRSMEQRWFPGVHSNVGGGYPRDGLANIPLGWLVGEAMKLDLEFDPNYLEHYRAYPQDTLYASKTMMYRVLEFVRLRRGKGVRQLVGHDPSANLSVDPSAIRRLCSEPGDRHERLERYRPGNLLAFLATKKAELPEYLTSIGMDPTEAGLTEALIKLL